MKSNTKHTLLALVIGAIVVFQVGAMKGSADYHYIALEEDTNIESASVTAQNSLEKKFTIRENVIVTAYSSTESQTDSTPFITASGTHVRDGIVAANWLPIGAKVKIPALFGDKVFTVEDRMAKKNSHKLDIWFAETKDAIRFGVKRTTIVIL